MQSNWVFDLLEQVHEMSYKVSLAKQQVASHGLWYTTVTDQTCTSNTIISPIYDNTTKPIPLGSETQSSAVILRCKCDTNSNGSLPHQNFALISLCELTEFKEATCKANPKNWPRVKWMHKMDNYCRQKAGVQGDGTLSLLAAVGRLSKDKAQWAVSLSVLTVSFRALTKGYAPKSFSFGEPSPTRAWNKNRRLTEQNRRWTSTPPATWMS